MPCGTCARCEAGAGAVRSRLQLLQLGRVPLVARLRALVAEPVDEPPVERLRHGLEALAAVAVPRHLGHRQREQQLLRFPRWSCGKQVERLVLLDLFRHQSRSVLRISIITFVDIYPSGADRFFPSLIPALLNRNFLVYVILLNELDLLLSGFSNTLWIKWFSRYVIPKALVWFPMSISWFYCTDLQSTDRAQSL